MVFSILAFLFLIISICIKQRKRALAVQSVNCLFEAIYDFTIFAYTGAILGIMNFIRTILFINKQKFNLVVYTLILLLFEGIIIINCINTWDGYISLLPTIGSVIRTYCLWQSNMKLIRISGLTTGIFYGLYYVYYHSWFMVLGNIILSITVIYALWKNDTNKKNSKRKGKN